MRIRILFSALLILFFSVYLFAEQNPVDSLKKVLSTQADDANKVNTLIDLSVKYRATSADTAMIYAEQAKSLAEKINYGKGLGYALKAIGIVYNMRSDYVNALQAWKEALSIFERDSIKVGISNMYNNIGAIYYNKALEDSAQDNYLKSLSVAEEINDTLRIATALMNLGTVYSNKPKTYDKALEIYQRALPLNTAIHDKIGRATRLNSSHRT